ncbi:DUF4124 domain-containing protein [Pseudidiomarina woesei]|uniref:DUF4124 domain-containing protein n=1 Tax=Pseudidiomarina woesei TaxID=1381080 RepID=A0A0K6H4N2_9GAMM|nr:DUF4124 domain-containing protein [Pseudidiomarina woesei]CUA85944.1 Domain of unknown function (DUF4124) [Pseudidiomarina woesei]
MKPLVILAVLLTFLVGVGLHIDSSKAQVYKKRNADGTVTYSDKPISGAEKVDVEPAPVTEFAKPTGPAASTAMQAEAGISQNAEASAKAVEFGVSITAPEHNQAIRANDGQLQVSWQSQPSKLPDGYNYELVVDGATAWRGFNSQQVTLAEIDRGERRLFVRIVDVNNQQVARSDTVAVFVLRASVVQPNATQS